VRLEPVARVTQGPIDNPVINSPFVAPAQHFVTVDGQPTGVIEPRSGAAQMASGKSVTQFSV